MPSQDALLGPKIELSGWGCYPKAESYLLPIHGPDAAAEALRHRQGRAVIGRGQGRAYGDPAINAGGICLSMTPSNRFLSFDPATGWLHAEAGATLEQILETFIPRGWFLPVTPGTKYPTLGGSVACDVHGKSKHPISHYLGRIRLLLADGTTITCSRTERPDLFWATTGGMGLTGLILSAEIQLQPIETSYLKYEGVKAGNLEEIFRLFEESEDSPLTVAWIDCLASGRSLGRSIMMRGEFAKRCEVKTRNPLAVMRKPRIAVPGDFPAWTLNRVSVAAFTAVIYGKHPRRLDTIMDYDAFFYPLDSVLRWNRIYGRPGMVQYQFLVPPKHGFEGVKTLLEAISATGRASFLAVLKKFGTLDNQGPLSFPTPGYFLALDFPVGRGQILKDMDAWDELVLKYARRLYLAKDSRMKKETFAAMYPRLAAWKKIKAAVDPGNVYCSDMARRLGLVER